MSHILIWTIWPARTPSQTFCSREPEPAILVPYPHAAAGHQAINAAGIEARGAAVVMTDRQLQDGALPALVAQTLEPSRLEAMTQAAQASRSGDAVAAILARIDRLVSRNSER